ncbi:hypothetical protein Geu3261_0372_006 [Komagataeibacter europaeus NBRC 3261]|uniref:Uncharacterized protein n=1 Tax=Komagataeibacter europaeus NBRC 3261 TaxID=1234669 RepID=A0A0D6Q5H7_KOMEU|nr:hypothetical protein [Komagataeibacter europaeus]GAN98021.1 hypothetical protein Geu3261_0372_006 [Komagataeibacter europaeus NBRC 3261]
MSDNRKTVAGYLLPATITAEHLKDVCAVLGYEIMSEETGESPASTLGRILRAIGEPIVFNEKVDVHRFNIATEGSVELCMRQLVFRDDMEAQVARVAAEKDADIARLQGALSYVRQAITSDLNSRSIICTVWAGPGETLVDYIDAALNEGAAS